MKKYLIALLPILFFLIGINYNKIVGSLSLSDVGASDLPYSNSVKKGEIREFDLIAAPTNIPFVNGETLELWAYNGQVPGPEFRVQKGDTLRIHFTNNLPDPTTIHFHGIRLPNDMDGVPDVTQEPVLPGEQYDYEFQVKDAGTFWYHPHVRGNEQVERGLYGTIVVEDTNEPEYSQDIVAVIDDWRITSNGFLDENFDNAHDIGHDGRWGNVITVNGSVNPEFELKQNERIRMRLVNTSNARVYALDFSKLDVKAIAVDGILTREPFDPDGFELAPGNRIDLDIKAPTSTGTTIIRDRFADFSNNLFTITVNNEQSQTMGFDYPRAEKYPKIDTSEYVIHQEYALDQGGMGMMHNLIATINGQPYPEYLESDLEENKFQVIRFSNSSARLHPMHLHGQFFKVMARNGESVDEPFMRDTVLVHGFETVDVGLVPIDGGDWALHCHILEHAEAGMMTVVEVK